MKFITIYPLYCSFVLNIISFYIVCIFWHSVRMWYIIGIEFFMFLVIPNYVLDSDFICRCMLVNVCVCVSASICNGSGKEWIHINLFETNYIQRLPSDKIFSIQSSAKTSTAGMQYIRLPTICRFEHVPFLGTN